jgi:hypothetical protein
MTEMLRELQMKIKNSAGPGQKALLLEFLEKLIALKNSDEFTEEEAGYRIVSLFFASGLDTDGESGAIFDAAARLEHPRETSYAQPIGHWDEKTADAIKRKEWEQLLAAVEGLK